MNRNTAKGFTLIEVTAAATLLVLALGLALSGYMYTLKNMNQSDIQNDLDIDVQLAMEKLKVDLRLSSLDKMFYYPEGSGPYTAISFPIAYDSDNDGIMEKDSDGKILWDETVVYHIRPTTPNQLVKTVFNPRDNTLTDVQRQDQLESVVKYGVGDNTYNAENVTSDVIFENLLDWELNPLAGRFDAYSADLTRDSASLGYTLLDSGSHKVTFTTVGKNTASKGYKIGIDQLFVSSSQSPREAEAQLPVSSESGATAVSAYMRVGSWKGSYQLLFPATSVGSSFTLSIANDRWEETNFNGTGYLADDTRIEFDKTMNPKDHVVQLRGNDITWEAALQTESTGTAVSNSTLKGSTVIVHINGAELLENGNWIEYNGRKCQLTFQASAIGKLRVESVYIAKSTSLEETEFSFVNAKHVTFPNGSSTSDTMDPGATEKTKWIDFEINSTNNYLVKFNIRSEGGAAGETHYPMAWENKRTTISDCTVDGISTNYIIGLKSITASYPEEGSYTSQVIDTHLDAPHYGDINFNAEFPSGTSLAFKIRSGDNDDLSDATDWDSISAFSYSSAISIAYKRYVQFQAIMTSDSTGRKTPKLKDVSIDWTGAKQLVDVGGIFTKGPNYGIFEISIDDEPLSSALVVDLEIYKDTLTMDTETIRVTSSLKVEITPRNSGL
ncbi:MAG: hypothetical protein V3V05_01545 [Pontiella sp.]